MDGKEKFEFINNVCDDLKQRLIERIHLLPENWDGYELRQWIKDYYDAHYAYLKMDKPRKRNYNNKININSNLL